MMLALQATNPDEVEFTLSVTHKLKDWRLLRQQLSAMATDNVRPNWPAGELFDQISDIIRQATQTYLPKSKDSEETDNGQT